MCRNFPQLNKVKNEVVSGESQRSASVPQVGKTKHKLFP